MVQKDSSFIDIIKAVVNYEGAFELDFGVGFMDTHIEDIVIDKMSWNNGSQGLALQLSVQ